MKRIFATVSALCLGVCLLAACGGGETSSSVAPAAPSSAAPSSVAAASSAATESAPAVSTGEAAAAEGSADVEGMVATLSEAAALGGTIPVSEIDLTANGLDTTNVVAFAGAESKLSSENGGIVMVFEMQPGTTDEMVTALEAYRDARASDDRYAEFATARENTAQARIVESGNLIIYAVSATGQDGGWDALDSVIEDMT